MLNHTEPIVIGNDGEHKAGVKFGFFHLHDFTDSQGVKQVTTADCGLFVIGGPVETIDVCDGARRPRQCYEPGDIAYLPAGVTLSTASASNTYNETLIRMPAAVLAPHASQDVRGQYRVLRKRETMGMGVTLQCMLRAGTLADFEPLLAESIGVAIAKSVGMAIGGSEPRRATLSRAKRCRVLEFIDAHLAEPVTLTMLADVAALSPYHFAREFKHATGMAPVQYLWARRIERAKRLLATSRISIADASADCGFSSQSHFTRAFKLATGATPAAWRRAL